MANAGPKTPLGPGLIIGQLIARLDRMRDRAARLRWLCGRAGGENHRGKRK